MKDNSKILNLNDVKILLEKYFDATISPLEMVRLDSIANDVDSGKLICQDKEISLNLHLISTFSKFAATSLDTIANDMPAGLEERMNSHISMLAAKAQSKKRVSPFAKAASFTTAAAVAAIIAFAGLNYLSKQKDFTSIPQIMIANASISDSVTNTDESLPSFQASGESIIAIAANESTLMSTSGISHKNPHSHVAKRVVKIQQPTTNNSQLTTNNRQPTTNNQQTFSISEETFKVMPSGVVASIDPAQILIQPITTLSQSINNIYESVETVSEALSGVSASLRAVSNSLALLSEPI